MNTDGTGFHTYKECHKTESFWNHTTTDHKEGEQLEDRRSVGESCCNCGDGTDQRVQSLMFMMMMSKGMEWGKWVLVWWDFMHRRGVNRVYRFTVLLIQRVLLVDQTTTKTRSASSRFFLSVFSKMHKYLQWSVDKKNQLDVTFCILYFSSNSCSTCFGQPCAHHHIPTQGYNITQSSAPDDGHMVARNMLSNY